MLDDPALLAAIVEAGTGLDICPTSNVMLSVVPAMAEQLGLSDGELAAVARASIATSGAPDELRHRGADHPLADRPVRAGLSPTSRWARGWVRCGQGETVRPTWEAVQLSVVPDGTSAPTARMVNDLRAPESTRRTDAKPLSILLSFALTCNWIT